MTNAKVGSTKHTGVRWRLREDGGRTYEARWRDKSGRLQSMSGFPNAKAASEYRADMKSEMRKGWSGDVAAQRKTWSEVADQWLRVKQSGDTKQRTIDGYRRILRQHFARWNDRKIGSIMPEDVTELMTSLRTKANPNRELSTLTKHNIFNVASSVFDFALRHRMVTSNPARLVRKDLPERAKAMQEAKERVIFLTPEEVNRLAEAVRASGIAANKRRGIRVDELKADGDALMIQFIAWTGLRRGEIAGLRLRHLDPLRYLVRVEETVTRTKDDGWVVGTPKTRRSRRTVPVPPRLMDELIAFTQTKGCAPDDYIWGSGAQPRDMASFFRRRFIPATKAAGRTGMRLHDLRHTYASIMNDLGYRPERISQWMGHSNVAFTLQTYTHLFESDEREAERSARLDEAFRDAQ